MHKAFANFVRTGALLFLATLAVMLWKRPCCDILLPPPWFYMVWAAPAALACALVVAVEAKPAWVRFLQFLLAFMVYGIAWFVPFRFFFPALFEPGVDRELAVGFSNFWSFSYRTYNEALFTAFLCLVVPRIRWRAWARAIWSGKTDALIATRAESHWRRAMRIVIASAVGALAAQLLVGAGKLAAWSWTESPSWLIFKHLAVMACYLLTLFAVVRLVQRKSGVLLLLAVASAYPLVLALAGARWEHVAQVGAPAILGLVSVAAFVRSGGKELIL